MDTLRLAVAWIACLLLVSGSARAQDNSPQTIDPDRPDVTNSAHLVPIGVLQLEAGWQYNHSGVTSHDTGTPISFRLGVTEWLEMRVDADGYLSSAGPSGTARGLGNIEVGAKVRLRSDAKGVGVLALQPGLTLPTANSSNGLGSGEPDLHLTVLTGVDFLKRVHSDINYGIAWIGGGPDLPHFTQHQASISTNVEIPGPVSPYVELYWFSRQDLAGGAVAAVDAGAIYIVTPRFALDGGFQHGLSTRAPTFSAFAGASVIIGNVFGEHGARARQRQAMRRGAASHAK